MDDKLIKLSFPAEKWEQGSFIGNGSMGAVLFGGTDTEKIYLSEESIWSGKNRDTTDKSFYDSIQKLRQLHKDGKDYLLDSEAERLMKNSISVIESFEYAGVISLNFDDKSPADHYSRSLDLTAGIFETEYTKNEKSIKERAFCAYPHEVTAVRYSFEEKTGFELSFFRENTVKTEVENDVLLITAKTQTGEHYFTVGIKAKTDGKLTVSKDKITVSKANEAVIFISITSQFSFGDETKNMCIDILSEADDFDETEESHIADFTSLTQRSDISFCTDNELEKMFTDKRIERIKNSETAFDAGLYNLYFAFGKYLLVSSSREGTFPANLQGVWAEKLNNPWNSDYHTNINLQMNYWLCEEANLSECHLQLFDYMNNFLLASGSKTAKENYGCRGTVEHHLSDIYGFTTPADGLWGIWPMGGAWLSTHMWEHWLYTEDKDYLKDTAYEYLKASALFFLDYMFTDTNGYLASGPSMSPENKYYIDSPNGKCEGYLCFSPTMDIEIIGAVLRNFANAANILGIDKQLEEQAEEALSLLPPLKVGKYGQLMEWQQDYDEPEPGHRHISHSFALYPDNAITEATPELYDAIKVTINRRLKNGGGHTGWSRAWLINLFARLKDGENTYKHIDLLLKKSTLQNMLDTHPPFQIDGNFGGAAGIAESLLQSHEGYISFLPAVKNSLSGSFTGLRARGGITVDCNFLNGEVTCFSLMSDTDKTVVYKLPKKDKIEVSLYAGKKYEVKLSTN